VEKLIKKINNRTAVISIIGLGYAGLPLLVEFADNGFKSIGIDINENKVKKLNKGINYISDVNNERVRRLAKSGLLKASTDFKILKDIDAISICVPTPLKKTKDPDISYILDVLKELKKFVHKDMIIILESTTYPGTTNELLLPELESSGLKVGKDFALAFSPERIDPGNTKFNIKNTPKVVGGVTTKCGKIASLLYSTIIENVITVSSAKAAEMVKMLENTFRAVNIGLVNEFAIMCNKLDLDTSEIIQAASTKPFGFMPFYPGPGLGGHCLPIDPLYLSWKLKTLDYNARFIELASEINANMPLYVVSKISDGLNNQKKSVNGSRIFILGVTYKPNVDDIRESPALDIIKLLMKKKADVTYNDPYVSYIKIDNTSLKSQKLTDKLLSASDCVVIVTDHKSYDWNNIVEKSHLIIDTRNATKNLKSKKIIKI